MGYRDALTYLLEHGGDPVGVAEHNVTSQTFCDLS